MVLARRGNEKIKTNKSLTRKKQEAVRPSTQWDVNGLVNQEVKRGSRRENGFTTRRAREGLKGEKGGEKQK